VNKSNYLLGIKSALPTMIGYFYIGLSMGVVASSVGLSAMEVAIMSIIVYAGSAQFMICSLIMLQSSVVSIIITTFFVNFRHFLLGLSASLNFKKYSTLENVAIGTLLTDETYSVLMTKVNAKESVDNKWMHGLNIASYLTWIVSTTLGCLIGNWIPSPERFGLDYALVAMFIGLFVIQVKEPMKNKTVQTIVIILSVLICVYLGMKFMSAEIAVIVATLVGCSLGVITNGNK